MSVMMLIPARGGSRRVPRKNMERLCGVPLVGHAIRQARESCVKPLHVVVSTDDGEIAAYAQSQAVVVVERPATLAQDHTPMLPVIRHALESVINAFDVVVLLQPTSPLRTGADIDWCVEKLREHGADAVVSVTEAPTEFAWKCGWLGRMREERGVFLENGAVYALSVASLNRSRTIYGDLAYAYEMPKDRSLDIDTPRDLEIARMVMEGESLV